MDVEEDLIFFPRIKEETQTGEIFPESQSPTPTPKSPHGGLLPPHKRKEVYKGGWVLPTDKDSKDATGSEINDGLYLEIVQDVKRFEA